MGSGNSWRLAAAIGGRDCRLHRCVDGTPLASYIDMPIASKYRRLRSAFIPRGQLVPLILPALLATAVLTLAAEPSAPTAPPAPVVSAAPAQTIDQLEALARGEAALHLPPLSDRQRLMAGPIPTGRPLQPCGQAVQAMVGIGAHMQDRVLVELRCAGPPAWHLYVPVRIVGTSSVAVAAHAIVSGSVLTAADLRIEQRDMPGLPPGYLDNPSIAVGLTAARPIAGGAIVTNQLLVASRAVQRGQSVTLLADAGGISVRMAGKALSDGLVNQRVKVQNLSSGKIVEGIARSDQLVEIIFQ